MFSEIFELTISILVPIIEGVGVAIIAIGILFYLLKYAWHQLRGKEKSYYKLRCDIGKVILLGLEILVAGDIIYTVATEPTLKKVAVLAIIVAIRTFLSFALQIEIEGVLPWKKKTNSSLENKDNT